jgi:type IV pilus assembly protein PilQ
MAYINSKYPWGGLAGVLLSAMLIFGCAGNETVNKDPLFDKWSTMGETATGHSPAPRDKSAALAQQLAGKGIKEEAIARELPKQPINLKLRQADVRTILRALAKIADLNILVKNEIKGEMTVDFRDVPWSQAFKGILQTQGLTYEWEGDVIRVMTLDDADLALKRKVQEQNTKWVEPLETVVIPVDYAKPQDLKENLESFLTRNKEDKPRGSVRVDAHSNSLIISAIRDDIVKMLPIIESIDKPTPQIQIKANIIETTKETARQLGIQWGGMYARRAGNSSFYLTPGGSSGSATSPGSALPGDYLPSYGTSGVSGQGFGVNFPVSEAAISAAGGLGSVGFMIGSIGGNILDLQLNALQKDSKLNILSSPSITTLDNQKAFTENGEKVPYVSVDKDGNREVKFEDAVLRLEITPHVIDGKNLQMKILVKKDEVDLSRTVDGNPFIIKKQTETNLIVHDEETIVISGLTKQRALGGDSGVPWMKDVPVLGWLFKSDDKSQKMEEVLIFITPKVLQQHQVAANQPGAPATIEATVKPDTK